MIRFFCFLANLIWILLCRKGHRKFLLSIKKAEKAQEEVLFSIIKNNENSSYGCEYGFSSIKDIHDFQVRVPLAEYEAFVPYIQRIADGEKNVLTTEDVLMFELSSGSLSASKYIPYTKSLKEEFQKTIKPWIYNLYMGNKGLFFGQAYWSISPVTDREKKTSGGIPVGFEEDSEYFGMIEQFLLNQLFAVPSEVKKIENINAFRYLTLLFLLKARHLSLFSVWSPTFLTLLFEHFNDWKENLVSDLGNGTVTMFSSDIPSELLSVLVHKLGKNRKRALEISGIIKTGIRDEHSIYELIWPDLKVISCWTCANAKAYVPKVRKFFPTTAIQGKGLLATEGVVSFPTCGRSDYVLAINSHFLEFIEINAATGEKIKGRPRIATELETGKVYSVILTTGGGFYRYKLHDLIEVAGYLESCPTIKFLGKEEKVSDYFGEKLNEYHVSNILDEVFAVTGIAPEFYMLAPDSEERDHDEFSYTLFLELNRQDRSIPMQRFQEVLCRLEKGLLNNYHYRYCRELGQLNEPRIFLVDEGMGVEAYIKQCRALGQRIGNTKPAILNTRTGWSHVFPGSYLHGIDKLGDKPEYKIEMTAQTVC